MDSRTMEAPAYELVSFVATAVSGEGISLHWNTATEGPNTMFTVERSSDRMNWRTAFTQDGEGAHSGYTAYEVMDMAPFSGISYYRLIATQGGEELEVSDDFAVEYNPVPALRIHGDRDPERFTVRGDGSISDVQLLNNRGQFMPMNLTYVGDQVLVRTEGLEPGTYFVQAIVNGNPVLRTVLVTATGVIGG
ncbi:MAG: hypothetical protein K8H89_14835 [Flavobacteriales bacterium]|nr:hypothetical protein [Flavobacteriales bacterium]MCB0757102.1 hypothetical protein [Flavobacteriales bacterium]